MQWRQNEREMWEGTHVRRFWQQSAAIFFVVSHHFLSLFKYNYSFSDRFRDGQYSFVGCFSTYGAPVPYEIGSGAKMTETSTFNSL